MTEHTDEELHEMADQICAWFWGTMPPDLSTMPPWLTKFMGLIAVRTNEGDSDIKEVGWGMIVAFVMAFNGYNPLTNWLEDEKEQR